MKILAIETSCDDTGIAILEADKNGSFKILSNIVSSQIEVHKEYGGVYPTMAKREHQRNLVPVLIRALKQAKLLKISNLQFTIFKTNMIKKILEREPKLEKKLIPFLKKYEKPNTEGPDRGGIDLIAVTNGPGLEPCLWVGVNFAKALSYHWNIPVIPVSHIESHILVNYLNTKKIKLPALSLVVSGGHTQLILMKAIGKYEILGETRDDAAGECFDKCAKILGLGYPGGPIISTLAKKASGGRTSAKLIDLPRPMINTKDYDFSFSGLKTAVLYYHNKQTKKIQKSKQYIYQMCFEVQQSIIDVLLKKTIKAAKDYRVKSIILGGGVSANKELRIQFKNKIKKEIPNAKFIIPDPDLSTDNALMTAITGFYHQKEKLSPEDEPRVLKAEANLRIS
jgi:N6-L-threonylcarbamoyladenine synthase